MITVENWAEIRRLHRSEGISQAGIARTLGISRNTVAKALASDRPPKYERAPRGSSVDAVEARVRVLLAEFPTMPATVIAERIGWERGLTVLKKRVRELRPLFVPPDPASRTSYQPGELAPCRPRRDATVASRPESGFARVRRLNRQTTPTGPRSAVTSATSLHEQLTSPPIGH